MKFIANIDSGIAGLRSTIVLAPTKPQTDSLQLLIQKAIEVLLAYREQKVTEAQLHSLSDRALEDIGIARSEIKTVARYSVRAR